MRRTTVAAADDDLAVLAGEARRRGTSLARLLGEAVAEKANRIRRGRRPSVGIFQADVEIAVAMDADPDGPAATPFRS
jgi:hypothetical protein